MSLQSFKKALAEGALKCPQCSKPIQKSERFVETVLSVWDGPGDSGMETGGEEGGSKVTLICSNGDCSFKERTEYWRSFIG